MVEGSLLKSRIIELALKLNGDLIKLLLSNPRLRQHFFAAVAGVVVFDKGKGVTTQAQPRDRMLMKL